MQPLAEKDPNFAQTLCGYAAEMLLYIDALLLKESLQMNPDFVRNLYELYSDILEYYAPKLQDKIATLAGPKMLRDGLQ